MLRFVLLAVMSLPVTPALAEISVTNDRGGSVDISRDCTRTVDQVSCTRETLLTGPEGKTALKNSASGRPSAATLRPASPSPVRKVTPGPATAASLAASET